MAFPIYIEPRDNPEYYYRQVINDINTNFSGLSSGSSGTSTLIQPGLNTYTGGTSAFPTVNISAATLNFLSATTISATTFYGDGSNLTGIIINSFTGWTSGSSGTYSIKANNDTTTNATGDYALAIGQFTLAQGDNSFVFGFGTFASGDNSSAFGYGTQATGPNAHAEGGATNAIGDSSHAQGQLTFAIGSSSHAGGLSSKASGTTSFVHGEYNIAGGNRSAVLGGSGITGLTDDTVYVPFLNIRNIYSGTPVITLGLDSIGNVVTGTTGSAGTISIARAFMFMGG